ncbi:hypothetical protein [Longimicrobium sp.]|jgi:hypothetical protein|uniref:hypothetical protein n=1 Tax=Longimicrobium sp. TaxID=2029185 RepID=UPI002EDB98FB
MAIREGCWDCPTCGSVALPGRQVNCTGCGNPRPQGTRFYLPEDAPEVSDAVRLAQARGGADWVCEHCGASARAVDARCPGCGAERGSSAVQATHEYGMDDVPRSGEPTRPRMAASTAAPPRPKRRWKGPAFVLALLGAFGWCNSPKEVTATVAEADWQRAIEVQEYRTVREEDWSLPSGARQLSSERAIRDYRQVLDHYETRTRQVSEKVQVGTRSFTCGQRDMGNGYFEDITCTEPEYETRSHTEEYQEPIYRREPVYGTKYSYELERWLPDDTAWARGGAEKEPAWPAVRIGKNEREGARVEKYVLRFRDEDGKTYEREVPMSQFSRYRPGQQVRLKMRRGGGGEVEIVEPES